MKFTAQREVLLRPLQQVVNVVERRQTLPVLSNLLVTVSAAGVSFTGSDMEVEMVSRCEGESLEGGEGTIPARKLFDIVRSLPDGSRVDVKLSGDKATVSSGRSRFTLATLPSAEFPQVENIDALESISLPQQALRSLIEATGFAMAHQDVRYYLNGLLFEVRDRMLRCVATDGHRLALRDVVTEHSTSERRQIIIPRKGILELQRLLEASDSEVTLEIGRNHIRMRRNDGQFTSKLIDGRFPDYEAVIPIGAELEVRMDRMEFRAALQRASILCNEKYRGVKLEVSPGKMRVVAHNPEQEEANEEIEAQTTVDRLSLGFNVTYLMDALNALSGESILLCLRDGNSSCLIREVDTEASRHVVMPLRL